MPSDEHIAFMLDEALRVYLNIPRQNGRSEVIEALGGVGRGHSATHVFIDDTPVEASSVSVTPAGGGGGAFVPPTYLINEFRPQRISLDTLSQQLDRLEQAYEDNDCIRVHVCPRCDERECVCCTDCGQADCRCGDWLATDECDCADCRLSRQDDEPEEEPAYAPVTVTDSVETIEAWIAAHA